ncbi:MAG: hypothetical protein IJ237_09455 [Oscillospiraceae bacterium]|nr:hypothetical protein [Oscillospiraceae bacterium]
MDEKNYRLKALVIKAVENQMKDNEPPITNQTVQRLIASGNTEEQAKNKIADILAVHIFYATSFGRPFHLDEYEKELNALT